MQETDSYLGILPERGRRGLPLERVYRQLFNRELYLKAYGRIYRNHGAMTRGITEEVADHASYNVAKKVLEWEFKEEIPRSRLRAAYGEGFKGAPLHCQQRGEEVFTWDETTGDAQVCSQKAQAVGGLHHV